jgi:WD40 repeat protein
VEGNVDDSTGAESYTQVKVEHLLYSPSQFKEPLPPTASAHSSADPIVVTDCQLTAFEKEDVPSQHDGVLLFIGSEVKPGEVVPKDRTVKKLFVGDKEVECKQLREGDWVAADQLLAIVDDRLARDDVQIGDSKLLIAKFDQEAYKKGELEYYHRWKSQERLFASSGKGLPATSQEEMRAAKFQYEKSACDAQSKGASVIQAERELNKAKTTLKMHEIRSAISGYVMQIYKYPGESVKNLEPVFQVRNPNKIRVEGRMEAQYIARLLDGTKLRKALKVVLEPSEPRDPQRTLYGHLKEVTSVAVGRDKEKSLVFSSSDDGTVRVWEPKQGKMLRIIDLHQTPGRSLACTGPGIQNHWLACGCQDGVTRLYDIDNFDAPAREFKGQHHGPVTSVAFSPDGATLATGGEDRKICLWDTGSGALRYGLAGAHKGAVTSLQFTPRCQLISAARDTNLRIWTLGKEQAKLETPFPPRSGDVAHVGASPDGRLVLFDQGKEMHILSLPKGLTEGSLNCPSGASGFTTFALFSPHGKLILTASGADGRIQLWRTPNEVNRRGIEIRHLVPEKISSVTCAAFAPEEPFLVTGTKDNKVLIWRDPSAQEIDQEITADLTLVEQAVEGGSGQVRVRAELQNPDGRLIPGTKVNMLIHSTE